MSKVFILEPSNLNVSTASEFGEIVYVYNKGERRSGIWTPEFADEAIGSMISKGWTRCDYFVIVGNMVPMILIASKLVGLFGLTKVLLFEAASNKYVEKVIGENPSEGQSKNFVFENQKKP